MLIDWVGPLVVTIMVEWRVVAPALPRLVEQYGRDVALTGPGEVLGVGF